MIYQEAFEIVPDDVFLAVDGLLADDAVYLKIEGLNPAGSIKMKTALGLIEDKERRGLLQPGGKIIESSSGNLGISLGLISAAKDYQFTCVCDINTAPDSIAHMRALGTDVVIVDNRDANGGFLGSRINYIKKRLAIERDLIWTNQYANPAGADMQARTTAAAILRELHPVDHLFIGAGTTGTLMGCAAQFRKYAPRTQLTAVDARGSVTFGNPPEPRFIPGIGTSQRPDLCQPELIDDVMLIDELDTIRACRWLAHRTGLLAGGSTGSVLAAIQQRRFDIPSGATVVAVAPDLGDHYLQTIYSDDWVSNTFDVDPKVVAELYLSPSLREEMV